MRGTHPLSPRLLETISLAVNWGGDTAPAFGTLIFSGAVGNTNIMDANYSMNQLNWNGSSAWVLNNSGGSALSLFDNGGVQAKLESLGTGGVTINAPVTFAATAGAAWGEINAVSSSITFGSTGTLNVTGAQVAGIRMFGGSGAISTTFNNTVSASGKYFATSNVGQTVNLGGSFTAANFYLMNTGTLNLNTGGNLNGTAVRLGGDFATTGTQNLALGATFNLTPATGGLTFAGVVNSVASNTSGALVVNSQNTSGTNTLSNQIALDSALRSRNRRAARWPSRRSKAATSTLSSRHPPAPARASCDRCAPDAPSAARGFDAPSRTGRNCTVPPSCGGFRAAIRGRRRKGAWWCWIRCQVSWHSFQKFKRRG